MSGKTKEQLEKEQAEKEAQEKAQKEADEKAKAEAEAKKGSSITTEELNEMVKENIKNAFKEVDFGLSEIKHKVLPYAMTEEDEKLPTNEQAAKRANKFFRAIYKNDKASLATLVGSKALSEGISSSPHSNTGQYLYNTEFDNEVHRLVELYGVIRRNATIMKMNRQKLDFPVATSKMTGAFTSELGQKTEDTPTFTKKTLTRNEYAVLWVASKQLLEDEDVNILPIVSEFVAEDFALAEDTQGFSGTGSPITGIFNYSGTTPVTLTSNSILDITGDDLIDMTTALTPAAQLGAKFYFHRSIFGLIRKLKTLDGQYIWQPLAPGAPGIIAGFPYEVCEAMPTTADDAADTGFIVFGNLKQLMFGDRLTIETKMTEDATIGNVNLFEQNAVGFRFEQSYDIEIALPEALCVLNTHA